MPAATATSALNAIQTLDGWRVVRLGEVSAVRRKQVKPYEGDSRPFVGLENMSSGGTLNGHSRANQSISNKTVFFEGDTLYGKLWPNLRKVVRADFDGVCSTDILAICGNERLTGNCLNHLVRSDLLYNHAKRGVTGTRMPSTSWTHLRNFRFHSPSSFRHCLSSRLSLLFSTVWMPTLSERARSGSFSQPPQHPSRTRSSQDVSEQVEASSVEGTRDVMPSTMRSGIR